MKVIESPAWVLSPTGHFDETVSFFRDGMGLSVEAQGVPVTDTNFSRHAQFKLPGGTVLEVVEPRSSVRELFRSPILCIAVDDVVQARREMEERQVVFVTETYRAADGTGWAYFRAPDGNLYQIFGSHPGTVDAKL